MSHVVCDAFPTARSLVMSRWTVRYKGEDVDPQVAHSGHVADRVNYNLVAGGIWGHLFHSIIEPILTNI